MGPQIRQSSEALAEARKELKGGMVRKAES